MGRALVHALHLYPQKRKELLSKGSFAGTHANHQNTCIGMNLALAPALTP